MDWQDYIEQVIRKYISEHPERTTFPGTIVIEQLRNLAINNPESEFGKMWDSFNDSLQRVEHIRSVLEEMVKTGKTKKTVDKISSIESYSLVC